MKVGPTALACLVFIGCGERSTATTTATTTSSAITTSNATATTTATSTSTSTASASPTSGVAAPEGMVLIPAGRFLMGGEGFETTPRHEVWVAAFYLDAKEVTMRAYEACVTAGKCVAPRKGNPFCNALFTDRAEHPVNCVDARDADAYCAFVAGRLPTEREWEYAARGGSEQRTYSWGEEPPDGTRACYAHAGGSCVVGSYAAGAFGLFDMSGNVWEWTSSYFGTYPDEATSGVFRVYRGGSWSRRFPKWLRSELRNRYRIDEHGAALGMRCARSITPTTCAAGSHAVGERCVGDGSAAPLPPPSFTAVAGVGGHEVVPRPPASASPSADPSSETPVRTRSPQFDADCGHYPGFPNAYTWRGGTFGAREPLIAGAGCKKRDIGVGWTSACCPS